MYTIKWFVEKGLSALFALRGTARQIYRWPRVCTSGRMMTQKYWLPPYSTVEPGGNIGSLACVCSGQACFGISALAGVCGTTISASIRSLVPGIGNRPLPYCQKHLGCTARNSWTLVTFVDWREAEQQTPKHTGEASGKWAHTYPECQYTRPLSHPLLQTARSGRACK